MSEAALPHLSLKVWFSLLGYIWLTQPILSHRLGYVIIASTFNKSIVPYLTSRLQPFPIFVS